MKARSLIVWVAFAWIAYPLNGRAADAAPAECAQPLPDYAPFDPTRLSAHVRVLAADGFEGRAPGSKGETLTLNYLSQQFASFGLKPAGDNGGWTQTVPLRQFSLVDPHVRVRRAGETTELKQGLDWAGDSQAGVSQVQIRNAPVVFVGYGVSAPERDWDDYKGIDLHGKVAVFLINDPDFETPVPGKFGGTAMTYYGRWTYKFEEAARRGARAALIVHEDAPAAYGWSTVSNTLATVQFDIERPDPRAVHPLFQGWLSRAAAVRLFERAGLNFENVKQHAMRADFKPLTLKDTSVSIAAHVDVQQVVSHNVIAQLSGGTRPEESLVYSAHWDHLGVGTPDATGDRIYNGAVDNAVGVAGLLELARVFAQEPPPARSVLFIAFTGEEKNLLGSQYYVQHPVRPLERTAAVFNMDTFSPYGPACDVQLWVGPPSTLEQTLTEAARSEKRTLTPDNHLEAGHFYRSDNFPFALQGVPAFTVTSGQTLYEGGAERGEALYQDYFTHHYHQPSDEWSPEWDLRGVALDVRLLHDTGRRIADANEWPQWQVGSEFKAIRDASAAQRSSPKPETSKVDEAGTLHIGGESIPYSDLATPEAKRNFIDLTRGFERVADPSQTDPPTIQQVRERLDQVLFIPGLERLRQAFAVEITPARIGGVQTDVVVPAGGIPSANKHRVLINLHGGGMQVGGRYGGQMESVPIASLGAIKVITVDYRMAPEARYPAASEDVAKVYSELLKSYRPESIGIYGCSSGAVLTGESIAWFQTHGLPRPGAIGLFGSAPVRRIGDSNYMFTGGQPALETNWLKHNAYYEGADENDPSVIPTSDSSVLRQFPPSLLISGTRDAGLSPVVFTHSRLVDAGVQADLHVWEGAAHCAYAQPVVDPDVPENRQAWTVITRFFDEHLGRTAK